MGMHWKIKQSSKGKLGPLKKGKAREAGEKKSAI